jgi:hypothetical protein
MTCKIASLLAMASGNYSGTIEHPIYLPDGWSFYEIIIIAR